MGKDEAVTFELDSLSTVAVSGASRDVNIDFALNGAISGYQPTANLYAILLDQNNQNNAYARKISFTNGAATVTFDNLAVGSYELQIVQKKDNGDLPSTMSHDSANNTNNNYVYKNGSYCNGFIVNIPENSNISGDSSRIQVSLDLPAVSDAGVTVSTIMDHAINYGISAESINKNGNISAQNYTNYATKELYIKNEQETHFNNRYNGSDEIPNIIGALISSDDQKFTPDKKTAYYFSERQTIRNGSERTGENAAQYVRDKTELDDKVELIISRTLDQCESLSKKSVAILPKVEVIDATAYPDNGTIILDATAINNIDKKITIKKDRDRP